jgi:hypothetical protein
MPYFHWETDRRRQKSAEIIEGTRRGKPYAMIDVVQKATTQIQTTSFERRTTGGWQEMVKTTIMTKEPAGARKINDKTYHGLKVLGQVLLRAAALKEKMDYNTDEKLVRKYLNSKDGALLHPRRTLDQAYYWTLKDTRVRDRDQVVYRATAPPRDIIHPDCFKTNPKINIACQQCIEDSRKVPRVIMCDQLWMWVLDQSESFPKVLPNFAFMFMLYSLLLAMPSCRMMLG